MSDQSNPDVWPELQLIIVSSNNEKKSLPHIDLMTQYRILNKKCDEVLTKIYNRRIQN